MANKIKLGKVAGLSLSVAPSAIAGSALLWAVLGGLVAGLLDVSPVEAVVGGLIGVVLHWLSEFIHQVGHAVAARRTGYPMTGVRFWGVLSTSLYPGDEPALPAAIHIRRALGGPCASLLLALVAAVAAWLLRPVDETPGWIGAFFFLENLLVFGLGALLPLGFTDGSTLLEWRGKR